MSPARDVIVAADPGLDGAFAILVDGQLMELQDMPTLTIQVGGKDRRRVDVFTVDGLLRSLIRSHAGPVDRLHYLLEEVGPRPKEGSVQSFAFGRGFGILESLAVGLNLPLRYVQPAVWTRELKLRKGKDAHRQRAMELFPEFRGEFARVKDDGRADAALIGLWGHIQLSTRGAI